MYTKQAFQKNCYYLSIENEQLILLHHYRYDYFMAEHFLKHLRAFHEEHEFFSPEEEHRFSDLEKLFSRYMEGELEEEQFERWLYEEIDRLIAMLNEQVPYNLKEYVVHELI